MGCRNCGGKKASRSTGIVKKYLCYNCDRVFISSMLSEKEATCPYCKAVPCVSCGKLPTPIKE